VIEERLHREPLGSKGHVADGHELVREAAELLMRQRTLTWFDAVERLHGIAAEVGIELSEAASLVLALDGP
jgi:hypothetical protein